MFSRVTKTSECSRVVCNASIKETYIMVVTNINTTTDSEITAKAQLVLTDLELDLPTAVKWNEIFA